MQKLEVKLVRIGNSRGIRLPADVIARYRLDKTIILETRENELALRPKSAQKLTWEQTYKEMAAESEDWSDLNATLADGLE